MYLNISKYYNFNMSRIKNCDIFYPPFLVLEPQCVPYSHSTPRFRLAILQAL